MRLFVNGHENLARLLGHAGHAPDLRCGGRGTCGRCGVHLLSGEWEVDGRRVTAPADALACRTRLLGESGEIEFIPFASSGKIAADWDTRPLRRPPAFRRMGGRRSERHGSGRRALLPNPAAERIR